MPGELVAERCGDGGVALNHARHSEAAVEAGSDVVGVTFAPTGFVENLLRSQAKITKVVREQNAREQGRSGGAAAHAERDLVLKMEADGRRGQAKVAEHLGVGHQNEVVVEAGTQVGVATGRGNREGRGRFGPDGKEERHGQAEGIKAGPEIGRGGRKASVKRMGAHAERRITPRPRGPR